MKILFNYAILILLLCTSCASDDDGKETTSLESKITGNWTDNFGQSYVINNTTLTEVANGNVYTILTFGSNFIICQNDANNSFSANLYSKFVFTNISNNELNFCQSFFDSVSLAAIENSTEPSNSDDLDTGCGGFAWSTMIRD